MPAVQTGRANLQARFEMSCGGGVPFVEGNDGVLAVEGIVSHFRKKPELISETFFTVFSTQ